MNIKELHVENFMGVEVVDITPQDEVVTIGGKNGAGKSSVLNAIVASLGGASALPDVPIRKGQEAAVIRTRISRPEGDLLVTRTVGAKSTKLTITTAEGADFRRPQELLDSLVGSLGFDPHAFSRLDPKRQAEQLRQLVGLDFSQLDAERARVFSERTAVNRDVAQHKALADKLHHYADAPESEVSVTHLLAQRDKLAQENQAMDKAEQELLAACRRVDEWESTVDMLERKLAHAKEELAKAEAHRDGLVERSKGMERHDLAEIDKQIAAAEDTNRKVRANRNRAETLERLAAARAQADALTQQLGEIDAEKARQLSEANWPVEGLGFSEDGGVTFRGLPFQQASSAEQMDVSLAIGMALNPKLRVLLIRDGSLIDDETMAVIRRRAQENGFQLWIERVSNDGKGCSLVISEGRVVGAEAPEATAAAAT